MWQVDPARLLESLSFRAAEHFGLTSGSFGLFLLAFLVVYPLVSRTPRARVRALLVFSLYFYYKASGLFVVLLVASALVDHVLVRCLESTASRSVRRALLWGGVAANLGVLIAFRYSDAWIRWLERPEAGWIAVAVAALPIGVSFYTFQKISYLVDVARGKTPPAARLEDFLLYVCFFPRVLAGPIVRAGDFLPQLRSAAAISRTDVSEGVCLIVSGLFKKAVIADYIGPNFVDRVFASPALYTSGENLLAMYGYGVQIYCDFSGYTDVALGLGRLVGLRLPANFDAPYLSRSITEFWRRWHITLSQWLREYLFLPVAYWLSRRIEADRLLSIRADLWIYAGAALVTWLVCGLWHGATWGFVIWGLIHGLVVTLEKVTRWPQRMGRTAIRRAAAHLAALHVIAIAWVFFRAESVTGAVTMLRQIVRFDRLDLIAQVVAGYPLVMGLLLAGAVLHVVPAHLEARLRQGVDHLPLVAQSLLLAVMVWIVLQSRSAEIQPFIYFRF